MRERLNGLEVIEGLVKRNNEKQEAAILSMKSIKMSSIAKT